MSSPSRSTLDLSFNEDQQAIADAVIRFCQNNCDDDTIKELTGSFPEAQWKEFTAMGLLSPATPEGADMGGAAEICAISEALGNNVFPGPVAASFLAVQVLPEDKRQAVMEGSSIVSLSNVGDTLIPFAHHADIFLQTDGVLVFEARPEGNFENIDTLGGEPWGKGNLVTGAELENSQRSLTVNSIATAAWLCGAGMKLVQETSEYATVRKQFGKTLGEFQAVAHPLADAQINLTAAQLLARAAASCFDVGDLGQASVQAAAARMSANRAALGAAFSCHQVYAGIGITLEGPAFHITRRIRQTASQAPGSSYAEEALLDDIGLGK
jgi:alkylation response protein AidB-like acyl-CoA dehydrogenase